MLKSRFPRWVSAFVLLLALVVWPVSGRAAAPSIASVVNGASFLNASLPNGKLAPGVLFTAFGTAMGPATIVHAGGFPLPTTAGLGGTVITAKVGATIVTCIMIYSLATQVAAILPDNTPVGTGTMTVTFNGVASAPFPITVVASSVGIFAINQGGSGPAVMTDPTTNVANSAVTAASQGELLDIWTTGLGVPAGGAGTDESKGPAPGNISGLNVQVFVGTQQAQILYQGRSGCCAGEDQIRIMTPGVFGCAVPISVVVNGVPSNWTTMSTAQTGTACSDAGSGYSASLWATAQANGGLRLGLLSVQRFFSRTVGLAAVTRLDSIGATYIDLSLATLLAFPGGPSPGNCQVLQFPLSIPSLAMLLGAGTVNVSGPVGNRTLVKQNTGLYSLMFDPGFPPTTGYVTDGTLITAGTYSFNVTAGTDIGAHTGSINHPATFAWNEFATMNSSTISRSQALHLTWIGGTPGAMVQITGISYSDNGTGAEFVCYADGGAGSFSVPVSVLQAMPASGNLLGGLLAGSLSVKQTIVGARPTIPGIDIANTVATDLYSLGATSYQ